MNTVGDTMRYTGDIQYTGGYHEYSEYTGECSVHQGDIVSTLGAYHNECGEYHEYTRRCSVHWGIP